MATTIPQPDMAALVARQREATEGALLDQRHQLLDLDPDSRFDYPGACCVNCPPRDTEERAA